MTETISKPSFSKCTKPSLLQAKAAPAKPAAPKIEEAKEPPDLYGAALKNAGTTTAGLSTILALGFVAPSTAFSSMITKFGLASICGYQVGISCQFPFHRTGALCKRGVKHLRAQADPLFVMCRLSGV